MSLTALAQTPDGSVCDLAIHVDSTYKETITTPGSYWYTAWTYDLPLRVVFRPTTNISTAPRAEVDFTCVPGVYTDSILNQLFTDEGGARVNMPAQIAFKQERDVNGDTIYTLSVSDSYRDMMSQVGLTYDVQAFVKVSVYGTGTVDMTPDTTFRDCMNAAQMVQLGDTFMVQPNDKQSVIIMPYSEWKNDSIRLTWIGNRDLIVVLSHFGCQFDPENLGSTSVYDYYVLPPNGTHDITSQDIDNALRVAEADSSGGLYYVKLWTEGMGYFVVSEKPERQPDMNAKLLAYDQTEFIARDTHPLFAIHRQHWTDATVFTAQSADTIRMEVATTADFSQIIERYTFTRQNNGEKTCHWSIDDIAHLLNAATDDKYIYVRFLSNSAMQVTPQRWSPSVCAEHSIAITIGEPFEVQRNASNVVYRLQYDDIKGGSLVANWAGSVTCPTYIADTCVFNLTTNNRALVQSGYLNVPARGSMTRDSATVAQWETRTDGDGFLFVRFRPTVTSNMTFLVNYPTPPVRPSDPEPVDPDFFGESTILPSMPQDNTLVLTCSDADTHMRITVTEAQTVRVYQQGQLVAQRTLQPADVWDFVPTCGVQYVVKGKENTIRFVR